MSKIITLKNKFINQFGWSSNRKIIVIESDDWGSFRFKNRQSRDRFMSNDDKYKCLMSYQDCFESSEDLQLLFNILSSVKDKNNNSAKFTFLFNPSNPNFSKIEENNFTEYFQETFLDTLGKRIDGKDILNSYSKAINENLLEIAFHGREHLNVKQWMTDLQNNDSIAHLGFKNRTWGFSRRYLPEYTQSYRSTFNIDSLEEIEELKLSISEGVGLINSTFNQKTKYFVPPDGPYHLSLNQILVDSGIKYIGLRKLHMNPLEEKWYQNKFFWLGKHTKEGLLVITRNVFFEPASPKKNKIVENTIGKIHEAFDSGKPVVISTHRSNYVGGLDSKLRDRSLKSLSRLLSKVLKKWPDVEFMTSTELGVTIRNTNSN